MKRFAIVCISVLQMLFLVVSGCGEDSPSEPATVTVAFTPEAETVELSLDEIFEFRTSIEGVGNEYDVDFRRGTTVLSHADSYFYRARIVGADSLEAVVTAGGNTWRHKWDIDVDASGSVPPPAVYLIDATHNLEPGSVHMQWENPPTAHVRALAKYHVRVRYDGAPTNANWDEAQHLAVVDYHEGSDVYRFDFDDSEHPAIHPGETAWIAIRLEDEAGLLSNVGNVCMIRISYEYYIRGHVYSDENTAIKGAVVRYLETGDNGAFSDDDGVFEVGPFRDFDRYRLTVKYDGEGTVDVGDCYGVVTDSIGIDTAADVGVCLIELRSLDEGCDPDFCDGEFLGFLRHLTWTSSDNEVSPDYEHDDVLRKWDDYPVPIYIPYGENEDATVILSDELRWAVNAWNRELGDVYFTEVGTIEEAAVEVRFRSMTNYGQVTILQPAWSSVNEFVPEFALLELNTVLGSGALTREVMMHELGHALGIGGHSSCVDGVGAYHLMAQPPYDIIARRGEDDIISAEEEAVVRAVRNLPQGSHMSRYFLD